MKNYSIGIINYNKRFDSCLKPLISRIRQLDSDIEIILMINGNYKEDFDQNYLQNLLAFISQNKNIYPTIFPTFRGCAKMWNTMLLNMSSDNLLFLSDDVDIYFDSFLDTVDSIIKEDLGTFTINDSFSHWVINKKQVMDIGWFDERLLGFGEEDGDFVFRYIEKYGHEIPNRYIGMIRDKELQDACATIKKGVGKYTKFNRDFIFTKYIPGPGIRGRYGEPHIKNTHQDIIQYPYETFRMENIDKL